MSLCSRIIYNAEYYNRFTPDFRDLHFAEGYEMYNVGGAARCISAITKLIKKLNMSITEYKHLTKSICDPHFGKINNEYEIEKVYALMVKEISTEFNKKN